jgi:hypothetical protein
VAGPARLQRRREFGEDTRAVSLSRSGSDAIRSMMESQRLLGKGRRPSEASSPMLIDWPPDTAGPIAKINNSTTFD